jgi:2-polyprenyl-3-methyl-5-hydroxy-6-metoxy-1,4-benzoquinol methylase
MMLNEGIRIQEVSNCLLCKTEGMPMYEKMRDRLFNALGVWNLLRCPHCGLVWLNPRPIIEDIGKVYIKYYTRGSNDPLKRRLASLRRKVKHTLLGTAFGYDNLLNGRSALWFGRFLGLIPLLKEIVGLEIMVLYRTKEGKLLDVGCGSGEFLANMKKLGWNVIGIEPDNEAAKAAQQQFKLPVFIGTLREVGFDENYFDAITMHHVLEHMPDPIEQLKECYRILKPGGRLIIVTPNIESFGHFVFKKSWRELDPPRHFFIFSLRTLQASVEKSCLHIENVYTAVRSARWTYGISKIIKKHGRCPGDSPGYFSWRSHIEALLFQLFELGLRPFQYDIGEEIVLVASKK